MQTGLIDRLQENRKVVRDAGWNSAADAMADAVKEITDLRAHLRQALRQWSMYAELTEANEGFNLEKETSGEGDLYRAALKMVRPDGQHPSTKEG